MLAQRQEVKLLPPDPSRSNPSHDEEDEEDDEDEDDVGDDHNRDDNEYVAAVCQYTTVLKETPPGFDDKKYEVNYMNLEKGTTNESIEKSIPRTWSNPQLCDRIENNLAAPRLQQANVEATIYELDRSKNMAVKHEGGILKKPDDEDKRKISMPPRLPGSFATQERRKDNGTNDRLIEYCDEEEECENEGNVAISGKLAIHLDTGETSREFCINRVDENSGKSHTREESATCASEYDGKPLFIKKYQGRFFQTDVETSDSDAPPVPPPRSKSKENSITGGCDTRSSPKSSHPNKPEKSVNFYDSVDGSKDPKVIEATYSSSVKGPENRLQGSFCESKNVEYLEKKELRNVESSDQSRSSSSDLQVKHRAGVVPGHFRRVGVVSMPPAEEKEEEEGNRSRSEKVARRISLDDLTTAFQGINGMKKSSSSKGCGSSTRKNDAGIVGSCYGEYQSDDSILEEKADLKMNKSNSGSGCQRRSKSEESLLERDENRMMRDNSRSRRNSPLSHSSSVNHHLSKNSTPERCSGAFIVRQTHSREKSMSKEDSMAPMIKSRIPVPVRTLPSDKEDMSSLGDALSDTHYIASPEPPSSAISRDPGIGHHSYVSNRYSERYTPSSYISSYVPASATPQHSTHAHVYSGLHDRPDTTMYMSGHNTGTGMAVYHSSYRPSSAKDYAGRYNYYSAAQNERDSEREVFLSGTTSSLTSPRWRRRSYDHSDSDYLRYQRRSTSSRPLSDYPTSTSNALNRSRSRSRVSSAALDYGSDYPGGYVSSGGTYSASRPSTSNYLYNHSYSNFHEGNPEERRQPRPPEYPPLSSEVSARTRRYQPEK